MRATECAAALAEAGGLICNALMLCEGMTPANNQMDDKQFSNAASGAFGLMAFALERAFALISEAEREPILAYEPRSSAPPRAKQRNEVQQ